MQMDSEGMREKLAALRASGADDADPDVRGMLEVAKSDPELSAWLTRLRAFDMAIGEAVRGEPVPPQLRDSLRGIPSGRGGSCEPASGRWRRPLAVAAGVALLAAGAWLLGRSGDDPARGDVVSFALELSAEDAIELGLMSGDSGRLRAWLAAHGSPHDFRIPAPLRQLPKLGCQSFRIDGRAVSLLCFELADTRLVHLFVVESPPGREEPGDVRAFSHRDQHGLSWRDGINTYILTSKDMTASQLAQFI